MEGACNPHGLSGVGTGQAGIEKATAIYQKRNTLTIKKDSVPVDFAGLPGNEF
jgi:hypothetical protein